MAEERRSSRWRCPACGTQLHVVDDGPPAGGPGSSAIRLACPNCLGQFRVKKKAGAAGGPSTSNFSGEVPAAQPSAASPPIGTFGLAWRRGGLRLIRPLYHAGNLLGGGAMFALGGFIPVVGGWLRDEVKTTADVLRRLGGVPLAASPDNPDLNIGPVVSRSDAADLFVEVAEVARRLGCQRPEIIRLTYLPCCGLLASKRSEALAIGLPLMQVLNRAEFRAVLAHELAHFARGDASNSARNERFVQALGSGLDAADLPSRSPLRIWARSVHSLASRLHAPIACGQEARADRAAAALAGGPVTASALVKVAAVQPLFREVIDAFESGEGGPNLYAFFRRFWDRLPASLIADIRRGLLAPGAGDHDPAHPPLLERVSAVQGYPPRTSGESDGAPATSLLGDPEGFELLLHDRLFAVDRVRPSVFHRIGS